MSTLFSTVSVASVPQQAVKATEECLPPLALIADDEPVIAESLAAILNGSGVAAITADGDDALETAMLIPPEILIADLGMSGMRGLDLAIEVKQRTPDCEVILLSGPAMASEVALRAGKYGLVFAMLVKPVHPVDLLSCVFEALERKGRTCAPREPARNSRLYDYLASTRNERDSYSSAASVRMRRRTWLSETLA